MQRSNPKINFDGVSLELKKPKTEMGGKNKGSFDGKYLGTNNKAYFVKQPEDKIELFTELFGGLFIEECKNEGLIDEDLAAGLVCANYVKLPNNTYALIQPFLEFTVLFNHIGTSNQKGSDRSAWYESAWGVTQYEKIQNLGPDKKHRGLSGSLAWSLILGDYSVHSGNIPVFDKIKYFLLGRIDLGACLRDYGHPNNKIILDPYEYHGWARYKLLTKNYIANYRGIPGLFNQVSDYTAGLVKKMPPEVIEKIIQRVIARIPTDMFTEEERIAIAKYISIDSFKNALCQNPEHDKKFVSDIAKIMRERIQKIPEELNAPVKETDEMYHSYLGESNEEQLYAAAIKEEKEHKQGLFEEARKELSDSWTEIKENENTPARRYSYKIERSQLLARFRKPTELENEALKWYANLRFFDKGEGGTKQVLKDFIERTYLIEGKAKLDFKKETLESLGMFPEHASMLITKQLEKLFGNQDQAKNFISAISQGPAGFIPFTIGRAVDVGSPIQIKQPENPIVNVVKKLDGNIYLEFFAYDFPIVDMLKGKKGEEIGRLAGPVKASFKLKQNESGEWGFELQNIETNNKDIYDILTNGKLISEETLLKYCRPQNKNPEIAPQATFKLPKKRKTPSDIAVGSIGRFFNNSNFVFEGVVRSASLDKSKVQTATDGIVFYTFFNKKTNQHVHAFYPTCDDDISYHDTISLKHALLVFKKSLKKTGEAHQLTIPIATKHYGRQHWLELFIEINDKGEVKARLTDSQSMGYYYPTAYIENAVKEVFNTSLETQYLNQQSLLNLTDCGHFYLENSSFSLDLIPERTMMIDDAIVKKHLVVEETYRNPSLGENRLIPCNILHNYQKPKETTDVNTFLSSSTLDLPSFQDIHPEELPPTKKLESDFVIIDDYSKEEDNDLVNSNLSHSNEATYQNVAPDQDLWASQIEVPKPAHSAKDTFRKQQEEIEKNLLLAKEERERLEHEAREEMQRLEREAAEEKRKLEKAEKKANELRTFLPDISKTATQDEILKEKQRIEEERKRKEEKPSEAKEHPHLDEQLLKKSQEGKERLAKYREEKRKRTEEEQKRQLAEEIQKQKLEEANKLKELKREEARREQEENEKKRKEAEERKKDEEDRRKRDEEEKKRIEEEQKRQLAAEEQKRKLEEEKRQLLEKQKAEEEKKRKEAEERKKEEEKRKLDDELRKKQDEEQRKREEEDKKRKEAEERRKEEEKRKAEEDLRKKQDEEQRKREEEEKKIKLEEEQRQREEPKTGKKIRRILDDVPSDDDDRKQLEQEQISKDYELAIKLSEEPPEPTPPPHQPSPPQNPPGFGSRNKGKILGGVLGTIIGAAVGAVPAILIITGVILLPATFGGSAALIGLGAFAGGALLGGGTGFGIGAWWDKKHKPASNGTGTSSTYSSLGKSMSNGKKKKGKPVVGPVQIIPLNDEELEAAKKQSFATGNHTKFSQPKTAGSKAKGNSKRHFPRFGKKS